MNEWITTNGLGYTERIGAKKMNNTLYEITNEYQTILDRLLDTTTEAGEVDTEIYARLSAVEDRLEVKAQNCAAIYLELESEEDRIKKFVEKIKKRQEKLRRHKESLKGYIDRNLRAAGIERIEGDLITIRYRNSEKVEIDNEAEIPEEYWRVQSEPNREAIREALKRGETMGAHLEPTKNIQIK